MSIPAPDAAGLAQCVEHCAFDARLSAMELRQGEFEVLLGEIRAGMADLGQAVREQSAMMERHLGAIARVLCAGADDGR